MLDIPLDVQGAPIDPDSLRGFDPASEPDGRAALNDDDARTILAAIAQAERPLILAGHGVRAGNAVTAFRSLVEILDIPVATTQLGKDILAFDSAHFVGHPGVKGDRAGNFAIQNADLIVTFGSSLHAQTTGYEAELFAPHARILQIELDPAIIARQEVTISRSFVADVASAIETLTRLAPAKSNRADAWRERCATWKADFAVNKEPHRIDDGPINFYQFADVISDAVGDDVTVVTDAGSAFYVLGQAFRARDDQRYIVSGALGAMGYALPASLGAAAANPAKSVLCITGDGSLQTNIHELQTLRFYNLDVKVFVINNSGYASIRNTQKGFFGSHFVGVNEESGVSMPPLDLIAKAYKLPYFVCDNRNTLADIVRQALDTPGPVICDIIAQPDQVIIPTVTSEKLPNGSLRSKPIDQMYPYVEVLSS